MRYWLIIAVLLPVSLRAQCAHSDYTTGFTCVQSAIPANSGTAAAVTAENFVFPANTTVGNGVLVIGNFCTANPCNAIVPPPSPANVTLTDGAGDTGWQPCSHNGSTGNNVRYWYCWWLPVAGSTTTFTMHSPNNMWGATVWAVEFSGACSTANCIDADTTAIVCGNPCQAPITTQSPNALVIGFGFIANTPLAPAAGWRNIVSGNNGNGIATVESVPETYTPTWTTTTSTAQVISCAIKPLAPFITNVPTMPVF